MLRNRFVTAGLIASLFCAGCVADQGDRDESLISQTHEALSLSSTPRDLVPLNAEAVYLPAYGAAIVDLALTPIPQPPTEADEDALHDTGEFDVVMVYNVHVDGSRDVLRVLTRSDFTGPNQIGPGGGCIHFFAPAKVGDHLLIGGVVRLAASTRSQVGAAPIITVSNQITGSPPNQWPFAALGDHELPAP